MQDILNIKSYRRHTRLQFPFKHIRSSQYNPFKFLPRIWRETPGDEADVPAVQSCRSRTEFLHSRSRSRAVSRGCKNSPFRNMTTQLYGDSIGERQLWSGNESVEFRYVNGSFLARTVRRLCHLAFLVKCYLYVMKEDCSEHQKAHDDHQTQCYGYCNLDFHWKSCPNGLW